MRLPIQYAITCPERRASQVKRLDLAAAGKLEFFKPDFKKFPCLKIALDSAKIGGTALAVMNAANETAVKAFLGKKISFDKIPVIIRKTLSKHKVKRNPDLENILQADREARETAEHIIADK